MKQVYVLAPSLLTALLLGGCDSFRNTFGLDHSSPNEWNTAEPNPGLILPPDYGSRPKLPPPTPGAPNPHVVPASAKVKKSVLGVSDEGDTPTSTSDGEQELIEKASENQEITPDIRKKIDEEAQAENNLSDKVISKIRSWKKEASDNLGLAGKKDHQPSKDGDDKEEGDGKESTSHDNPKENTQQESQATTPTN
jgi:hypothetical protein